MLLNAFNDMFKKNTKFCEQVPLCMSCFTIKKAFALINILQAVVIQNNLYLLNDVESKTYVALTTDGAMDAIFNGVPDWLYEGTEALLAP